MRPIRRNVRRTRVRNSALLSVLLALTAGCGSNHSLGVGPDDIQSFPKGRFERPSTPQPVLVVDGIPVESDFMATIIAVRSTLRAGAYELVTIVSGVEFSRRRVDRIGENLSLLPLPPDAVASISVYQSSNAGPLDVNIEKVETMRMVPNRAVEFAREMASRFEAETGQLADPAVENLVPNSSFAADDEVRGTPADWFAYVETSSNVLERRLRAWGTAPGRRPYLATGPMRIEPGRRYRVLVRMTVREGAVAVRIADYEELRIIADAGTVFAADAPVERRVDFTASETDRAARIRFEPVTPGERADFELSAIQMELLP